MAIFWFFKTVAHAIFDFQNVEFLEREGKKGQNASLCHLVKFAAIAQAVADGNFSIFQDWIVKIWQYWNGKAV